MSEHLSVLLNEVLAAAPVSVPEDRNLRFLDGTFGRGGHSRALLLQQNSSELWALDQDHEAEATAKIEPFFVKMQNEKRFHFIRCNFKNAGLELASKAPEIKFDFILLDLGVSSPQLDQGARGFSFYHDGPLDMRMDQQNPISAAKILNESSEAELTRIFKELGEAAEANIVAKAIVNRRSQKTFSSTLDLAKFIESTLGWRKKGFHPATQYFMALRLQVNQEISAISSALPDFFELLAPDGRLAIISFHSLEDRVVKTEFRRREGIDGESMPRRAIQPTRHEIELNPRSRSAKLRIFRKYQLGEGKKSKNKYAHLVGVDKRHKSGETKDDGAES